MSFLNSIRAKGKFETPKAGLTDANPSQVHLGMPGKQGKMRLNEGLFVLDDRIHLISFGIVQTGLEAMEFTYITLIRLPKGKLSPPTFTTSRKVKNNRIQVSHAVHWPNDSLTTDHCYLVDELPFVDEEFVIQDRSFSPKQGRLFLVDLTGTTPQIAQLRGDLPVTGWHPSINEAVVLDLATFAVDDLMKQSAEVRSFLSEDEFWSGKIGERSTKND